MQYIRFRGVKLEEMAFIKIFPFGKNGYNEIRENIFQKLTAGSYAKARVMSNDPRYQSVEYMFYLLAKLEAEKIARNISVCTSRLKLACSARVDNIHIYMKSLRGYASYWNTAKADLLAFIRNLGAPSWFITLSANDLNWPDMIKDLLYAEHMFLKKTEKFNFDLTKVTEIPYFKKAQLLHDYPAIAARHFDRRFKKLLKYLELDNKVLGGKVVDSWWRTEFQNRGSPHIHMLLWVENIPLFNTDEGKNLIDDCISCSINTGDNELDEIIKRVQIHKCTHTCFKKNKEHCRFNYPMSTSTETKILNEEEISKNNNKFVILKRKENEKNVNNYNATILSMWQGNMDIQPIGSIFGIAFYVAKYVAKEEPYTLQKKLQEAFKAIRESSKNEYVQKLRNVSNMLLKNRERSAQEASYVICGLPLRGSSRSTVFINTKPALQRTRSVRKECVMNEEFDETDFCSDIYDKYTKRPIILENICLHQFAAEWVVASKKNTHNDDDDNEDETPEENITEETLQLIASKLQIKKRERPAVIKVPHISINDNPSEYYYSLLLLYTPFRNENDILKGYNSPEDAYLDKFKLAAQNPYLIDIEKTTQLNRAIELINLLRDSDQPFRESTGSILENNDFERANDELEEYPDDNQPEPLIENDQTNINKLNATINERVLLFNEKQKIIFDKVKSYLTSKDQQQPILQILHGAGGTGKSFVAQTIKDLVNLYSNIDSENFEKRIHVIISAPTGIAAKNIKGVTNHMAFKLPIEKFGLGSFQPLKGKLLKFQY